MRTSVALVLGLSFTVGCAFQKPVSFNSEPTGASVRIGGREIGTTPVLSELKCRTGKHEERQYEISKEGYRKQSGELNYEVSVRNLVIDIVFFPFGGVGKVTCPKPNYHFELQPQTASLQGKATVTISKLVADQELYLGALRVHERERLVFPPGWQLVNIRRGETLVPVAQVHLDPDTDYDVGLLLRRK